MKLYWIFNKNYKFKGAVIHKTAPEAIKLFGNIDYLAQETNVKISRTEKPKVIASF